MALINGNSGWVAVGQEEHSISDTYLVEHLHVYIWVRGKDIYWVEYKRIHRDLRTKVYVGLWWFSKSYQELLKELATKLSLNSLKKYFIRLCNYLPGFLDPFSSKGPTQIIHPKPYQTVTATNFKDQKGENFPFSGHFLPPNS